MKKKTVEKRKLTFGEKVRAVRKKKGITQVEFAKIIGVTQRVVSYYENSSENPSIALVDKIAKALAVSPKTLLNFNDTIANEDEPIRPLKKRLKLLPTLSREDQKYIAQTIDVLAAKNSINTNK